MMVERAGLRWDGESWSTLKCILTRYSFAHKQGKGYPRPSFKHMINNEKPDLKQ